MRNKIIGCVLVLIVTVSVAPLKPEIIHHEPDLEWMRWDDSVSIPLPPSEHPRLYLRSRDLPDLRQRFTDPVMGEVWEQLQLLAGATKQYRIMVDALQYLVFGDRDKGRRAIETALDTIPLCEWVDPHSHDQSRPIGYWMVVGAIAYDWCYDLLRDREKDEFIAQFHRLASMLECGYPPTRQSAVVSHTSEWMLMRDMMSAGIAIYDEYPEMYWLAAQRFFKEHVAFRNWLYPGHAFHQGPSYGETRLGADMFPTWIFDRLGAGLIFDSAQQFQPYHWIYARRPDNRYMPSMDIFAMQPGTAALLCASYYGDGYVIAEYMRGQQVSNDEKYFDRLRQNEKVDVVDRRGRPVMRNKIFEFLWRDPDLKPRDRSELPLTRYMGFPFGWMIARTGWDENSVICEMKVNCYHFTDHHHADAGTFQIFHKGSLVINSGLYQGTDGGFSSPHNLNYYKRTIAHNTLLVYDPNEIFVSEYWGELQNDGGQRLPRGIEEPSSLQELLEADEYKTGEVTSHFFGPDDREPDFSYLEGDLSFAYSNHKVEECLRSMVFLNLRREDVPAAFLVFDRVSSTDPSFRKYWLLHSVEEPVVDANRVIISAPRGQTGRLINSTLFPDVENLVIEKVGGPGKEFWVFGKNFDNKVRPGRDGSYFEPGGWRIQLSPRKESRDDIFLNVMEIGNRHSTGRLEVERIDSEKLAGARIGSHAILFNKSYNKLEDSAVFHLTGSPKYSVLVTGLAPGPWQLWEDGGIYLPALEVYPDQNILYFEAGPGSYELRR